MYKIRKSFRVEYAHQLDKAYSKACSNTIHGHSGIVEVLLAHNTIDSTGMVMDFGQVKAKIKNAVMKFDHALIMPDTMTSSYLKTLAKHNRKLVIVPYNPTAENMAKDLFETIELLLPIGYLSEVIFHETDTGYASYSR